MKQLLLSALLVGFGIAAVCSPAHAQTMTFHGNDAFAETHFVANGAPVDLFIFSSKDQLNGTSIFLEYGSFVENPDGSATSASGIGLIPSSAFTANNLQHFTLDVDTSQVSGFRATTCIFSGPPAFSITCTDGSPLGPIHVDWQQNGFSSDKMIQHSTFTSGPFTGKVDRDQDDSSADATGSYLGTNFTDPGRASIGKARDSSISITRNN
ncbi:MAG TPA: hypothetical protein VHA33_12930 [Candidatus Angelobacter sp.]|jgi:hypothetical protein|nr:hypothetical protein [Candidatus Angelobacter sp.]